MFCNILFYTLSPPGLFNTRSLLGLALYGWVLTIICLVLQYAVVLPAIPEDGVLLMVLWRKVHSMGRRFLEID